LSGTQVARIFPNPAYPLRGQSVQIWYSTTSSGSVKISIYDRAGERLKVLEDDSQPAGTHFCGWDCRNTRGELVATGMYFLVMETTSKNCTSIIG
jgi:flagellar hook assembly protein FlgD